MAEFLWEGGERDEFSDFPWNALRRDLGGAQFLADGVNIDLGKALFQSSLAVEEHFQVLRVLQIADQRRVGQHGLQQPANGVVPAFASSSASEVAEESFHDVIGALGLNEQRPVGSLHRDRICKEFIPIFVDLSDQGFPMVGGRVIGA